MPLKNGLSMDVTGMFHLSIIIQECSSFMDLSLKCLTLQRHRYLERQGKQGEHQDRKWCSLLDDNSAATLFATVSYVNYKITTTYT